MNEIVQLSHTILANSVPVTLKAVTTGFYTLFQKNVIPKYWSKYVILAVTIAGIYLFDRSKPRELGYEYIEKTTSEDF